MKYLTNILFAIVFTGLIALAGVRLTTLLTSVPEAVTRVQKQQEAVRPARLDIVVVTDGTCSNCTKPQPFINALQKQGVAFGTVKQIDGTTGEGKEYVAQQKLERFPAVVIKGETSRSAKLEQFLTQTSTKGESQFVYTVPAPYHEVTSDKVRGLFRATYLTSTNCTNCYNVTDNAAALKNLGVNVTEDKVVTAESPEGKELIQQYKIRYLPTIILTGDLEVYQAFQGVWPQVGSKEAGGTYVLRDGVKLMGTYYDLKLKRAVTPKPNSSS